MWLGERPRCSSDGEAVRAAPSGDADVEQPLTQRRGDLQDSSDYASPIHVATLVGVSLLWATYSPAIRFIFSDPGAPAPVILTAIKTYIANIPLLLLCCVPFDQPSTQTPPEDADPPPNRNLLAAFLNRRTTSLAAASTELGLYNLIGSLAQNWGLALISATTASFIVQSTTVFTPLLALAAGTQLTKHTKIACAMATLGTFAIAADDWSASAAAAASATVEAASDGMHVAPIGIFVTLCSAACYSMATFRTSLLAPAFVPVRLAAGYTVAKTVVATVAVALFLLPTLQTVGWAALSPAALWPSFTHSSTLLVVLWAALGPGALATGLQLYGQGAVSAARTQVIFTAIPLWSAMIAWFFLHERAFGLFGWAGAALIIASGLLVART